MSDWNWVMTPVSGRKICVLGGGAMGTACSILLARRGSDAVSLWFRSREYASDAMNSRVNERLLPGVRIPENVNITSDPVAVRETDVVVVCVPTRGIRTALGTMRKLLPPDAIYVSAVKGIEADTLVRPSQMIREVVGDVSVVVLGGPCHAEEVAVGKPASIVAASDSATAAEVIQTLFSSDTLRVYSNTDLAGVELAGALKNVIAIAAGICDGLELGDNAKAALITRGLAEMVRFGTAMGVQPDTFFGLAGIGDLFATCGSRHSRNRLVGERLGRGHSLAEIQTSMAAVAEGVFTARSIIDIARKKGIEMPIAVEVYRVLFENKSPAEATEALMQRPLRDEAFT